MQVELVKEIWLMLMRTLRDQYEAIHGKPDVVFHKQQQFLRNLEKGRGLHLFWGQNKMEICSTKMVFYAPCLEKTMHEGFHYYSCWVMWIGGL